MYTLVLSRKFQKELEKTVKDNPKLKPQISKTLKLLLSDLKNPLYNDFLDSRFYWPCL